MIGRNEEIKRTQLITKNIRSPWDVQSVFVAPADVQSVLEDGDIGKQSNHQDSISL